MTPEVRKKFSSYPDHIQPLMHRLRDLIYSIADDLKLGDISENLKWGEPSYQVKNGSPVRMDWKQKFPDQYFLFFHCQTMLVETFRELYSGKLKFEGKRAIILDVNTDIPEAEIRHCLELAMTYKTIKHLPLLGA